MVPRMAAMPTTLSTIGVKPALKSSVTHMVLPDQTTPTPMVVRTQAQIGAFFEGFRLVEPGLVTVARWRPEPGTVPGSPPRTDRVPAYAGVGVKPEPGAGVDH